MQTFEPAVGRGAAAGVALAGRRGDQFVDVLHFPRARLRTDRAAIDLRGVLAAQPLLQAVQARSVIPQSFVISRDGRIVKHFQGFSPLSTPQLMRQAIEDALNDKSKA